MNKFVLIERYPSDIVGEMIVQVVPGIGSTATIIISANDGISYFLLTLS